MLSLSLLPSSVLCVVLVSLVRFGAKRLRSISSGVARCYMLLPPGKMAPSLLVFSQRSVPVLSLVGSLSLRDGLAWDIARFCG